MDYKNVKMMKTKYYILNILALSCIFSSVYAQEMAEKSYYSFDRIEMLNPWLVSANRAGLVQNEFDNYSQIGGYYKVRKGAFRNFNDPAQHDLLGFETRSYVHSKDLYFFGKFGYEYGFKKDQAWLGTVYPNVVINPFLDSIPGKVLHESYFLNAGVGYRLNKSVSIGVSFDYETAVANKRLDVRNKSTMSDMSISPGILFDFSSIVLGINFHYKHYAERVEYRFYGEGTKVLYYMEGLWMNVFSVMANTDNPSDRGYLLDDFGGGLQCELKFGDFAFYNQFKVGFSKEDNRESNNLVKRYAYLDRLHYNYFGQIIYSSQLFNNLLKLHFSNEEAASYKVTTIYERVPGESSSWAWKEYGKDLRYMQSFKQFGLEYNGIVKRSQYGYKWDVVLGVSHMEVEKTEKIFPTQYDQDYKTNEFYAALCKNFIFGNNLIDLRAGYALKSGNGNKITEKNPLVGSALKLNYTVLNHDFAYQTADSNTFMLGAKYSYVFNAAKGYVGFFGINYVNQKPNDSDDSRSYVNLSMGFNF